MPQTRGRTEVGHSIRDDNVDHNVVEVSSSGAKPQRRKVLRTSEDDPVAELIFDSPDQPPRALQPAAAARRKASAAAASTSPLSCSPATMTTSAVEDKDKEVVDKPTHRPKGNSTSVDLLYTKAGTGGKGVGELTSGRASRPSQSRRKEETRTAASVTSLVSPLDTTAAASAVAVPTVAAAAEAVAVEVAVSPTLQGAKVRPRIRCPERGARERSRIFRRVLEGTCSSRSLGAIVFLILPTGTTRVQGVPCLELDPRIQVHQSKVVIRSPVGCELPQPPAVDIAGIRRLLRGRGPQPSCAQTRD